MPAIRQFLFVSRLSRECKLNDVVHIISISRKNNARDGISGLMYFDGEYFCHYLEGEPPKMRSLSTRILADPRHHDVKSLLDHETVTVPLFENWRVGFAYGGTSAPLQNLTSLRDDAALVA